MSTQQPGAVRLIRPGLCSVTLRQLSPEDVISRAVDAGLETIEWGADVHAPATDPDRLAQVRSMTVDAGLRVGSYGSYQRFIGDEDESARVTAEIIEGARVLGAPRIRVWAGKIPSSEADADYRAMISTRLRDAVDRAGEHGIEIGLEFHRNTLTDDLDSLERLFDDVARPELRTYWQPNVGEDVATAIAGLERVLPLVSTVHVFSWWPEIERLPLSERTDLWVAALSTVLRAGGEHDALLEFIPDDDPSILDREAGTLRALIAESVQRTRSDALTEETP